MSLLTAPARLTSRALGDVAELLRPDVEVPPVVDVEPVRSEWLYGRTQQLWCEPGKHDWARPAVRGRKPTACPQHSWRPADGGGSAAPLGRPAATSPGTCPTP